MLKAVGFHTEVSEICLKPVWGLLVHINRGPAIERLIKKWEIFRRGCLLGSGGLQWGLRQVWGRVMEGDIFPEKKQLLVINICLTC